MPRGEDKNKERAVDHKGLVNSTKAACCVLANEAFEESHANGSLECNTAARAATAPNTAAGAGTAPQNIWHNSAMGGGGQWNLMEPGGGAAPAFFTPHDFAAAADAPPVRAAGLPGDMSDGRLRRLTGPASACLAAACEPPPAAPPAGAGDESGDTGQQSSKTMEMIRTLQSLEGARVTNDSDVLMEMLHHINTLQTSLLHQLKVNTANMRNSYSQVVNW